MYNKHSFYVVKLKMRDVFLLDILSKEQRIEQCLRYYSKKTLLPSLVSDDFLVILLCLNEVM